MIFHAAKLVTLDGKVLTNLALHFEYKSAHYKRYIWYSHVCVFRLRIGLRLTKLPVSIGPLGWWYWCCNNIWQPVQLSVAFATYVAAWVAAYCILSEHDPWHLLGHPAWQTVALTSWHTEHAPNPPASSPSVRSWTSCNVIFCWTSSEIKHATSDCFAQPAT